MFNESFVPPGKNKQAVCILWHEGEIGRKAHNIATTYVYFLRKYCRDQKGIYFFLDNCNAQNKNRILLSALVRVINDSMTSIDKITLEYFEPGHTFMAADAVHAAITKKIKQRGEVYDMNDFVQTIKSSRKNMEVDILDHKDMVIFANDSKITYPKGYNIQNLKTIEFRRGSLSIFCKKEYNEEFKEIQFLKKKVETDLKKYIKNKKYDFLDMIAKENGPKGISEIKKRNLFRLQNRCRHREQLFFKILWCLKALISKRIPLT